jgi:hypothetical protein
MSQQGARTRLGRLVPLILLVAVATLVMVAVSLLVVGAVGESSAILFSDVYELTGSRLTGLLSIAGVMLFVATAAVCLFASRVTWQASGLRSLSRYLFGAGVLVAVLAVDDYLSLHELADDVLALATGIEAGRALKNALEAVVLGVYGLLFILLLWRHRPTVASTEWVLLAIGGALLLASLGLDMAPHTWLAGASGLSLEAQGLVEDTLKLAGIAFCATYFTCTAASAVRSAAR